MERNETTFHLLNEYWSTDNNGNEPNTIVSLAGLMALATYYMEKDYTQRIKQIFVYAMNDSRWRVREVIQEALKYVAICDYEVFINFCDDLKNPNLLESRAIITTIAHPNILVTSQQKEYALHKLEETFQKFLIWEQENITSEEFKAFVKGLNFAPSVIVTKCPKQGFILLNKYIGKSKKLDRIIKENLIKKRLINDYEEECNELLNVILKLIYV